MITQANSEKVRAKIERAILSGRFDEADKVSPFLDNCKNFIGTEIYGY